MSTEAKFKRYNGTSWDEYTFPPSSHTHNYLPLSGGSITGNLTLYSASGDSPALIFQRGTLTNDSYNDWKIVDSGGYLYFYQCNNSGSWVQKFAIKSDGIYSTNIYSTNLGSTTNKITDAYITNIYGTNLGSSSSYLTSVYATSVYGTTLYENGTSLENIYVKKTRTINTKALSSDITLYAGDIPYSSTDSDSVETKISNLMNALAGDSKSYVINTTSNTAFDSDNDTITITSSITTIENKTVAISDLKVGDIILITDTKKPDRWVGSIASGNTSATLYKLEISKVALNEYLPLAGGKITGHLLLTGTNSTVAGNTTQIKFTDSTGNTVYSTISSNSSSQLGFNGKVLVDGTNGVLRPFTGVNVNLGTSSVKWNNAYITSIYGDTLYENGTSLSNKYLAKAGESGKYYVYATSGTDQILKTYTTNATASTIAYRDTNGNLSVAAPTADAHAVTKKYVDDIITTSITNVLNTAT